MNTWYYELSLLLAAAATLGGLARRLPLQNVLLASCIIGLIAAALERLRTRFLGGATDGLFLWTLPMLWLVLIINSRRLARFILRRWRQSRLYGFAVIGVASILAVLFDLALEWQFAIRVIDWRNAVFSALIALLSLFLATPALLDKSAMTKSE